MLRRLVMVSLLAAIATPSQAVVPAKPAKVEQPQTANIRFDPPIDKPLRYRWEKSIDKDGKIRTAWTISEYRFTRADEGFELRVTPIDGGTSETDPAMLAAYKRLEQLISRPFVLQLGADGTIERMKDQDHYWSAIISVLKQALDRGGGKKSNEASFRAAVNGVVQLYETMPAEIRLNLLTESVQPIVEFGETETTVGEPLTASLDTPSPFGGSLKQDVNIRLERVEGGKAHLAIGSSVPRAELQKLVKGLVAKVLPGKDDAELTRGLAALEEYRHDTAANYVVSVGDGMLESYSSVETIQVADKGKTERRVTTRKLMQVR
ncbi:MAG: hypothetical protein AVDCRST_MAG31-2485 [uncultured Sphingomonas sp.]|uniref:Uncharacterized protein n=1 Tax=uncultured Sphingomonas sp. TaxID=158754 RepID=A0A6J4TWS0_9SPHN|nr:hypothetical protein [uncultured Sphingomonas sp.]CAA9532423.1 MAG: hypothetical protein AVDCRST_MAG31-2485 [uncultured Sphingomonas sp.]